jgi:hypothetical protein
MKYNEQKRLVELIERKRTKKEQKELQLLINRSQGAILSPVYGNAHINFKNDR